MSVSSAGNDYIDSGAGDDIIYGGSGNNVIQAGRGKKLDRDEQLEQLATNQPLHQALMLAPRCRARADSKLMSAIRCPFGYCIISVQAGISDQAICGRKAS